MKKVLSIVTALVVLCAGISLTSGCKLTPEQMKVIAQQTGLFSAVSWIAADNPTPEAIVAIKGVVSIISEKASNVEDGQTYTEAIYPELVKLIDVDFAPQYRPLAKAASISLLGSVDMLFALHPEYKADEELALDTVKAFCIGATAGLDLDNAHPAIQQARITNQVRLHMIKSEQARAERMNTYQQLKKEFEGK